MITSTVADGVSLGPGCSVLFVQPSDADASEIEFASILLSVVDGRVTSALHPGFIVSRLVERLGEIFLIGRLGQVARLQVDQLMREHIEGPKDTGFLTDACIAGDKIYAVGMGRQVYVRRRTNVWSRADAGVLQDSNDFERVTGFRSVDALATDDVYAVGLDGEIWQLRAGAWRAAASPTNLILEQVRCTPHGEVYAVGQLGTIVRGSGEAWAILEQTDTQENFWGLEWFGGRPYLATRSQLFRLEGRDARLRTLVPEGSSFGRLRAGHGALWSFGPEEVRWSVDGDSWNDVAVPKAHAPA
jgi:hypothetical protein